MRLIPTFKPGFLIGVLAAAVAAPLSAQAESQPPPFEEVTLPPTVSGADEMPGAQIESQPPTPRSVVLPPTGFESDEPPARKPRKKKDYTAQQRPRVAVMPFEDTNVEAANQGFGKAVAAMLVTYLKRQSQLVIVERHGLEQFVTMSGVSAFFQEQDRTARELTNEASDHAGETTLEKLDAFVFGNVTYLSSGGKGHEGGRLEIDAKLLSRRDGRIIAASQVGGSVGCLRQIVQRLGNALEHEFLRPFYGKLRVQLQRPQYSRIGITPVLSENALDEERPPVELSRTITPGEWGEPDTERLWIANPATFTIPNVLAGWYTLRLRRPGYKQLIGPEYEVRGKDQIYDKNRDEVVRDPETVPLLVKVDRLTEASADLTGVGMVKKGGVISFEVRPDYPPDSRFARPEDLQVELRSVGLEINADPGDPLGRAKQAFERGGRDSASPQLEQYYKCSAGGACQQAEKMLSEWEAEEPQREANRCEFITPDYGPQPPPLLKELVEEGEDFSLLDFWGGDLTHEAYDGEELPVGSYTARIWAPNYEPQEFPVQVNEGTSPPIQRELERTEREVVVRTVNHAGGRTPHPGRSLIFTSETTDTVVKKPLDFRSRRAVSLKADRWTVSTDVPGFENWQAEVDLLDSASDARQRVFRVKADIWVLGRTSPKLVEHEKVIPLSRSGQNFRLVSAFSRPEPSEDETSPASIVDLEKEQAASLKDRADEEWLQDRLADFRRLLALVDLMVLDDADMKDLRNRPDLAEMIRDWVDEGHALIAYVSEPGDYSRILGRGLVVDHEKKPTRGKKLRFYPGGLSLGSAKIEIPLTANRDEYSLRNGIKGLKGWKTLVYSRKGRKYPRIVERGGFGPGGYVVVWVDSLQRVLGTGGLVATRDGERILRLKEKVEQRALLWAQYLVYERLSSDPENAQKVRARLGG